MEKRYETLLPGRVIKVCVGDMFNNFRRIDLEQLISLAWEAAEAEAYPQG
jgi:hypothetical protein